MTVRGACIAAMQARAHQFTAVSTETLCGHSLAGFRMMLQEVAQNGNQPGGVLYVVAVEGCVDIIDDHRADALDAMLLVKQVACQGGSRNFSDVLMLADGVDLVLIQAAHCNAVF
ncbi:MAG: hypothetical protein ACXWVR_02025 [Rhodoplanes sp.]